MDAAKNDETKQRKVAVEYVRLCGYKPNEDRKAECQNGTCLSLDQIAEQFGTSKRDLQRAISIERNLTEPMKLHPVKLGRCIKKLERIYGIQNGGNRGNQYTMPDPKVSEVPNQEKLAERNIDAKIFLHIIVIR